MEADAEHQQDDAEFRHLPDGFRVALEAGRERAERHAGDEIADNGGQAEPPREQAPGQRVTESDCDVYEEWQIVHRRRKNTLQLRGRD